MFCENCGREISNNTVACPACGKPITYRGEVPQNQKADPFKENDPFAGNNNTGTQHYHQPDQQNQLYYQQPVNNQYNNQYNNTGYNPAPMENPAATPALVMGIVTAAASGFPIFSIIFGIFALKKSKLAMEYSLKGYNKRPMGIIGKWLSIGGMANCGLFTLVWTINIITALTLGIAGLSDYNNYKDYYDDYDDYYDFYDYYDDKYDKFSTSDNEIQIDELNDISEDEAVFYSEDTIFDI